MIRTGAHASRGPSSRRLGAGAAGVQCVARPPCLPRPADLAGAPSVPGPCGPRCQGCPAPLPVGTGWPAFPRAQLLPPPSSLGQLRPLHRVHLEFFLIPSTNGHRCPCNKSWNGQLSAPALPTPKGTQGHRLGVAVLCTRRSSFPVSPRPTADGCAVVNACPTASERPCELRAGLRNLPLGPAPVLTSRLRPGPASGVTRGRTLFAGLSLADGEHRVTLGFILVRALLAFLL